MCVFGDRDDCFRWRFAFSALQTDDERAVTEEINRLCGRLAEDHPNLTIVNAGGRLLLLDVPHVDEITAGDEPELIWQAFELEPE
jgi:hypothetical protein